MDHPLAGATPVPAGWRPIELDLPVPGGSPYHFSAQNAQGIQPAVQGYTQAVRQGVQGMIPQMPHPTPQTPGTPPAGPHPMWQQFMDYLRQLMEQHGQTPPTGQHPLNPGGAHIQPVGGAQIHWPDVDQLFNHLATKR